MAKGRLQAITAASAAKSLQSCLTLWDPRLPHPWDSPGKNTGVGYHFTSVMSDSAILCAVAWQAPRPWDSPSKNTGVNYHALLQVQFSSVQSLSRVWLFATSWTGTHRASLSITNSQRLLKIMSIESVMPSNYLILCCPLLLTLSIFPRIRVFSNESALCIRWPKYWSFSFNISPSNEYSGLISFRIDWLDLLEVQGTLKSLLQHHSSKASILWCSAFFIVQLSHP